MHLCRVCGRHMPTHRRAKKRACDRQCTKLLRLVMLDIRVRNTRRRGRERATP